MYNERFLRKTDKSITIVPVIIVMLLLFSVACSKDKQEVIPVAFDPETSYTMRTTDVATLISDSGITRYKMEAKEWLIFGKAKEPFQYFPQGMYIEKFDTLLQIEFSARADTAYFFETQELWKAIGNVLVTNQEGERFETSLLYLDQKNDRIYSDKYMRIEQKDQIITGIGFESNQSMTKYKIFQSTGIFPVKDTARDTVPTDSPPVVAPVLPDTISETSVLSAPTQISE